MVPAVACVAVPDASGAPAQAALSNLPGLQLLLRILPFRKQQQQQHVLKLPHVSATMEELHRHPLWRYGSTAAQWPEPRATSSNRPLAPAEADSALLAYVRLVADAEQQQGVRRQGRLARLSPGDIAAELQALYTLAALHVTTQQQDPCEQRPGCGAPSSKQPMSDNDIMQLLKAYASLEDSSRQQGSSTDLSPASQPGHRGDDTWDSKAQAAAAAMGALYAFARLADSGAQQESQLEPQQQESQQQQQQPGQAPGQLQVSSSSDGSSAVQAYKSLTRVTSQGPSSSSMRSSSSTTSTSGDLQVLLKLAQLGVQQAAS